MVHIQGEKRSVKEFANMFKATTVYHKLFTFLRLVKHLRHSPDSPKDFHLVTMSGSGSGLGFHDLRQSQRQMRLLGCGSLSTAP